MKKLRFLFGALALVAGFALTACSSDDDDDNPQNPSEQPGGQDTPGPAPTEFKMANLMGVVKDYNGYALKGVTVANGTNTTTTDANGVFTFDKVTTTNGRTVIKFTKAGYIDIVKAMPQADEDGWQVTMLPETGNFQTGTTNFTAGDPVEITVGQSWNSPGIQVALPANYKDADGKAFTGEVTARVVFLSPDVQDFASAMPGGDLAAVRADGSDAQLISYGMVAVDLTDNNGKKLQLADGQKATLTFPVPESLKDNTPAEIPLWSFDETTGLWKEEGKATKQGNSYVGTVSHFSWWNLDYPESRATLKIKVVDENGKAMPNINVQIDGGQRMVRTNQDGEYELYVPSDTKMDVRVTYNSFTYLNGQEESYVAVPKLTAGETKEVTLKLPAVSIVSGTINNTGTGSKLCAVTLSLPGQSDVTSYSDLLGKFRLLIPASYKGVATVSATGADGSSAFENVTLDGSDKVVNISIATAAPAKSPGTFTLTTESGEKAVANLNADGSGNVSIVNNNLSVSFYYTSYENNVSVNQSFNFSIEDYSESKSSYTDVSYYYSQQEWNGNALNNNLNASVSNATLEVTRSGNNITFKVKNGDARYYGSISENYYRDGKADLEATLPITLVGKAYYNVDASQVQSQLPSFMPLIEGKKLHALILSECQYMGPGAVVCYTDTTITDAQYKSLATKAEQTMGEPLSSSNAIDDPQAREHFGLSYFQNPKYLGIFRNPWYVENQRYNEGKNTEFRFEDEAEQFIYSPENHSAYITVRAFTNVQVPITSLVMF